MSQIPASPPQPAPRPAIPLPANEEARIAALSELELREITREPAFDRIARLAADLAGVPIGLVTIILAQEQKFLGSCGMAGDGCAREGSFCSYGILDDAPLVVPDARLDPRFAQNPAVTGPPGVRFYAGTPLRLADGIRAGMLCVVDTVPRPPPDERTMARLAELAATAVDMIRLRVGALRAARNERRIRAAYRALQIRRRTIAAQSELLRTTLDTVEVGIAVIGTDRRISLSNDRFFDLTEAPEELRRIGTPLEELLQAWAGQQGAGQQRLADHIGGCMAAGGRRHSQRFEAMTRGGRSLQYQLTAMPDGRCLIAVTDMTEVREAERRKDEFIAMVSHELRTPLTSIAGSLGLLAGGAAGPLEPRARRMVEIAAANSERLVRLINDILDIEKLASPGFTLRLRDVDAAAAVRATLDGLRAFAETHGVRIRFEAPEQPLVLRADPDRFAQVVTNLVSNAVKFSPRGAEVRVAVGPAPAAGRVRLTVQDHGPGIPAAFRPRLFERFAQADASATRQKGGTGLGLAIVKEIVQHHGGDILVETEEGVGTTFHVDLPAADTPPQVVVCEADNAVAEAIGERLQRAGFRAAHVTGIEQALRAAEATPPPAVILVRQHNSDPSAPELIRALRARPRLRSTPVFVYAVDATAEILEPGAAAIEVLDWLEKPAELGRLAATIADAAPLAGAKAQRPVVLHLDDDHDLLQIVAEALAPVAEVISVTTLAEAREVLARGGVDVVVLDLTLPQGCGTDLLPDVMRASTARRKRIPVVIFSAREAEASFASMADAALTKGKASLDLLVETVQRVMRSAEVEAEA
ncbi:MAG: ATP-binding protein [Rhodovarius sp.]|nr:ATP-binding protein [Rhodovarius sp.]